MNTQNTQWKGSKQCKERRWTRQGEAANSSRNGSENAKGVKRQLKRQSLGPSGSVRWY